MNQETTKNTRNHMRDNVLQYREQAKQAKQAKADAAEAAQKAKNAGPWKMEAYRSVGSKVGEMMKGSRAGSVAATPVNRESGEPSLSRRGSGASNFVAGRNNNGPRARAASNVLPPAPRRGAVVRCQAPIKTDGSYFVEKASTLWADAPREEPTPTNNARINAGVAEDSYNNEFMREFGGGGGEGSEEGNGDLDMDNLDMDEFMRQAEALKKQYGNEGGGSE